MPGIKDAPMPGPAIPNGAIPHGTGVWAKPLEGLQIIATVTSYERAVNLNKGAEPIDVIRLVTGSNGRHRREFAFGITAPIIESVNSVARVKSRTTK